MRKCSTCGRGSKIVGHRILLRGHYNPTSKSRKYPNLQWAKVPSPNGKTARKLICTNCLKSLHKKSGPK